MDEKNNKVIEVGLLNAWLDMMIANCDDSIRNHTNIGTVKDGGKLGMKLAYENVKKEINDFQWVYKESQDA